MTIDAFTEPDRTPVHQLLQSHRLPLDGVDDAHVAMLVARDDERVVGCAAIEVLGSDGLLRSVAVSEAMRGRGLGQRLTSEALALARRRQLRALYLLTETAAGFFPKFGFEPVSRDEIPESVKASVEFVKACPASALAMRLRL